MYKKPHDSLATGRGALKKSNVSPLNVSKIMKNFIMSVIVFSGLFLTSTSCQDEPDDIISPNHKGSARDGIDLDEVTVSAYRNNDFSYILTLYYGNEYQITTSPYDGFLRETGNDDDLENVPPEVKQRFLRYLNTKLNPGFNDAEIAILSTLSIRQIFLLYGIYQTAINIGTVANSIEFHQADDNGFANAYRHMYLAFNLAKATGPDIAQQLLAAHEQNQGNNISTDMDTRNNALGIDIFENQNVYGISSLDFQTYLSLARNGYVWTIQDGACNKYIYVPSPKQNGPQN